MWDWYKFETDGQKIIKIEIRSSFSLGMHFVVCENDNKYIAYWRTELSDAEYFDKFLAELHDEIKHFMSLKELAETTAYKETLNKYSPVYSAVLNKNQKDIIDIFLKNGINENVREPHGRDGHSYFIEVYSPEFKKYRCWCIIPEEWSILADMLNMLADMSNLDFQRYGCRIGGKL